MRELIADGERLVLPALVLYEWRRGPRGAEELAAQEALFPTDAALPFGPEQAAMAARLYRTADVSGSPVRIGREVEAEVMGERSPDLTSHRRIGDMARFATDLVRGDARHIDRP
jgi:predicted nucleic acid-binding protein